MTADDFDDVVNFIIAGAFDAYYKGKTDAFIRAHYLIQLIIVLMPKDVLDEYIRKREGELCAAVG